MTVALSSLRVTSEMDASGYARGMAQKVGADQSGIASSTALGTALAQQDASMDKSVAGVSRLSRSLVDGYGSAATFEAQIRSIGNAVDRGMGLDRAAVLLDLAYRKFGLVADGAVLAKQGFVSIVPTVDSLNQHYANQAIIVDRLAASQRDLATAQSMQTGINGRLGIGQGTLSARDSASTFQEKFAEDDSQMARAKAAQAGDAFGSELNARMIAGTAKSARDSASVFQTEMSRMDELSRLRAEQTGSVFGDELNARLIAGVGKSARDSATVFQEEFARLDQIAQLRAQQTGAEFQRSLNERMGIGAAPKSAQQSAGVFQEQDQKAKDLDDLRAKYDPLYVAQQRYSTSLADINKLYATGKIDQDVYLGAIKTADGSFKDATTESVKLAAGATALGSATAFGNTQFMALTAAIRHSIDAMIAGRPVTQAIAMEMGNLSYGLSGAGGVLGALKAIGGSIAGFLSPMILMFVGVAAAVLTALAALNSFKSAQMEVTRLLAGAGRASGATVGDINQLSGNGLSISEARGLGTALAATGKVGVAALAPLVQIGHDFAATFGISASEAAKELAAAFSDPVKGADKLNERLGFLDDKTKVLIASMVAQGQRQEAVAILIDRTKASLVGAADITGFWTRTWNGLSNAISDAWTRLGQFLDRATGGTGGDTFDQQITAMTTRLQGLQKAAADAKSRGGMTSLLGVSRDDSFGRQINDLVAQIEKLRQKQLDANQASADAKLAQRSLEIGGLITAMVPGIEITRKATDATVSLNEAMNDPALQKRITNVDSLALAYGRWLAAQKASTGADPVTNQIAGMENQIRALDERSIAARRQFATDAEKRAQSLDPNAGNDAERTRKQQLAGQLAAGGATAVDNVERQRIGTLGQLASVAEIVRSKELEIINVRREGINITRTQETALLNMARAQEEARRASETVNLGVATEAQLRYVDSLDLQTKIDQKLIVTAEQKAAAEIMYQKKREDSLKTSAVNSSQLPQLARLGLDAGDARLQIDALATGSLGNLSTALSDIVMGTKHAGEAFRNLGIQVILAIEQMIIKMLILAPIAKAMQATLGGAGSGGGLMSFLGLGGGSAAVAGTSAPINIVGGAGSMPVPTFANGGIMTSAGQIPLNRYANGGVANSPQMALFAEGKKPEAYVPLPDGRSIPVNINVPTSIGQGAGGGVMVQTTVHLTVQSTGDQSDPQAHANAIAATVKPMIEKVTDDRIVHHLRPRGLLNPMT